VLSKPAEFGGIRYGAGSESAWVYGFAVANETVVMFWGARASTAVGAVNGYTVERYPGNSAAVDRFAEEKTRTLVERLGYQMLLEPVEVEIPAELWVDVFIASLPEERRRQRPFVREVAMAVMAVKPLPVELPLFQP
jgi:hypothetical protein